jgi:hypothetical protein
MQESAINTPTVSGSAYPPANQHHGRHKATYLWPAAREKLWNLEYLLANSVCILWSASRSWVGHIRSQSATKRNGVEVGPVLQRLPDGSYRDDLRTAARASGIEKLSANLGGFVDNVDLRIFLIGFDEGEEWSRRNLGNETETPAQ